MKINAEAISEDERYDAPLGAAYMGPGGRERDLVGRDGGIGEMTDSESHNGMARMDVAGEAKPRLPSLDLEEPAEPVFTDAEWLETGCGSLADHPLLRALLLELPPRGSIPPPDWLDRWFEATRSILELLYAQDR